MGRGVAPGTLQSIACAPNLAPWALPSEVALAHAVGQLKTWRVADGQGLFAELLKAAGSAAGAALHSLVVLAIEHGVPAVARQV